MNQKMRFVAVVAFLGGCAAPTSDEVARVNSPSGKLDAIVHESSGGATTSFKYDVFVVERGAKAKPADVITTLYGTTRNDDAYGLNLRWHTDDTLYVEYFKTKSIVTKPKPSIIGGITVQVLLRDGVVDASAPRGGMEYNLQQRK